MSITSESNAAFFKFGTLSHFFYTVTLFPRQELKSKRSICPSREFRLVRLYLTLPESDSKHIICFQSGEGSNWKHPKHLFYLTELHPNLNICSLFNEGERSLKICLPPVITVIMQLFQQLNSGEGNPVSSVWNTHANIREQEHILWVFGSKRLSLFPEVNIYCWRMQCESWETVQTLH